MAKKLKKKIIWLIAISGIVIFLFLLGVAMLLEFEQEKQEQGVIGVVKAINLDPEVEQWRDEVEAAAAKYHMEEYVELILAVMQQESGGRVPDVMQAAEGAFNTRYPHVPNGITDPIYSIECGIQELQHALTMAGVENSYDLEHIKLALQGYNFGPGYISWALERDGGYTEDNAVAFSDMMAAKYGWRRYGDKQYVAHVLRYYSVTYTSGGGGGQISSGEAANIPLEERMNYLFPNGKPGSSAEMQQYLTRITVPIVTGGGEESTMQLTVHKALAEEIQAIFAEMKGIGFPVKPSTTAGYNWRTMVSSGNISHHSYGCVIDLNWDDNPYISGSLVVGSSSYAPGSNPYSVTTEVVEIWKRHGFYWGGDWKSAKDYMHFTYTNH